MWYADTVGVKKVYDSVANFTSSTDDWEPAPLLKKLSETGGKFAEYERGAAHRDGLTGQWKNSASLSDADETEGAGLNSNDSADARRNSSDRACRVEMKFVRDFSYTSRCE